MKLFILTNPLEGEIRAKFMTSSSASLLDFPAMRKSEVLPSEIENQIDVLLFIPNYIKIGDVFFRVVCSVLGDAKEIYVTREAGEIINFSPRNAFLLFINITQIQQISAKMGIALKN